MSRGRNLAYWACLFVGIVCLVAASILFVTSKNLFDARTFGLRAEESLSDPGVAAYAAEMMTRSAVASSPDLIAVRPLILAGASGLCGTRPFQALVGRAAQEAHHAAFSEGAQRLLLSIPDARILLESALQQASPQLAAKIPKHVEQAFASFNGREADLMLRVARTGGTIRWLYWLLFPVGALLLVLAVWAARNRGRGLTRVGIGLIVAGVILAALVPAGGLVSLLVHEPLTRGLLRGLWRTFLSPLRDWGLLFAGLGVVMAAGASSLLETLDPIDRARQIGRMLVQPPHSAAGRLAWATTLLLLGTLAILRPLVALDIAMTLAGVSAAFVGARELFRLFRERLVSHGFEVDAESPAGWRFAAGGVTVLAVAVAAVWFLWRFPSSQPAQAAVTACNGHSELCDRRVDEVVFPGTHNSMSNQEAPGWMFPHHQAAMPRQLRDGIRALLYDVHYGFPGGARVKTDMDSEPLSDKVKEAVGEEGFQAAMRIRNRLVGVDEGRRVVYLCHGLCELGAYPLEPTLEEIREFFVTQPDEVVLMIVEDYVTPQDLAAEFEKAKLKEFVYTGPSSPQWPTLRQLINSGQRLIVFIESGRPGVDWIRPAFRNLRETPYSFHSLAEFSCRANRGGDEGSLFLMNNWIETTPTPKPSNAAIVNAHDALLARTRQCESERHHMPNIIAVDFYRTGDLLRVADELNGVTATASPTPERQTGTRP